MIKTILRRVASTALATAALMSAACGVSRAAQYTCGNHTGSFIDGANVYGQGAGAQAVLTYQDVAIPNLGMFIGTGTLTFTTVANGPIIVPITIYVAFEPGTYYIWFEDPTTTLINLLSEPTITEQSGPVPQLPYTNTGWEYTYTGTPPVAHQQTQPGTITISN